MAKKTTTKKGGKKKSAGRKSVGRGGTITPAEVAGVLQKINKGTPAFCSVTSDKLPSKYIMHHCVTKPGLAKKVKYEGNVPGVRKVWELTAKGKAFLKSGGAKVARKAAPKKIETAPAAATA